MLSIVIPTYNREELLKRCLDSITRQNYLEDKYEIIVVDDGSSDQTIEYLEVLSKSIKNLKYIRQDNCGHSVARNLGFSKAKGEIIVSLDDDCIPCDNWLNAIAKKFDSNSNLSVLCGRILNPTNTKIAWAEFLIDFSLWMGLRQKNIKIAYTANTAYRRRVIEGCKLQYDGKEFGYRDSMFNYEFIKMGYRITYCPDIKVKHYKWECTGINDKGVLFIKEQIRRGKGFRANGYKIHGKLGYYFTKLPATCFIIIKSVLILYRALFLGLFVKYIYCFDYILSGLKYQASGIKGEGAQIDKKGLFRNEDSVG